MSITPRKLGEIIAFQNCSCQCSQPNMDHYRELLSDLLDAYEESLSLNLRLLPVEQFKQGKLNDIIEGDTVKRTIVEQMRLREVLTEERGKTR